MVQLHRPSYIHRCLVPCLVWLLAWADGARAADGAHPLAGPSRAARGYLGLIENFSGFAESHWNERAQSYDAWGKGVTWARGNGGVVLVNAVLLTELPERATFSRTVEGRVRQEIGYCALPRGVVVVFSRWWALADLEVAELVDHPFRWVRIDRFIPPPDVRQVSPGVWTIDDRLRLHVLGNAAGELAADGIDGALKRTFQAKAGEILQDSICVYQAILPGRAPPSVAGGTGAVRIGDWSIQREDGGRLNVRQTVLSPGADG